MLYNGQRSNINLYIALVASVKSIKHYTLIINYIVNVISTAAVKLIVQENSLRFVSLYAY